MSGTRAQSPGRTSRSMVAKQKRTAGVKNRSLRFQVRCLCKQWTGEIAKAVDILIISKLL